MSLSDFVVGVFFIIFPFHGSTEMTITEERNVDKEYF